MQSIPGLFIIFDEQRHVSLWNKQVESICGYSAEELSKFDVLEFFETYDRDRINKYLESIFSRGSGTFETNLVCKDQTKIAYFLSGNVSVYKGKKSIICLAYEISERRAAEEKLIAQLEELRRWHAVTLKREERILELKQEINQLLFQAGKPPRYSSEDAGSIKEVL